MGPAPAAARGLLAGLVSTALWCCASSALILFNKRLYDGGFPYPLMVTGLGQVFTVLAGLLLAATGAMPLHPPPRGTAAAARLLPIVGCTAATMYWGNTAYMHLSLSFIQILKAFTPALTLAVGAAAGLEQLRQPLVAAVLLIALGTGGAVLAESGTPSYSWLGLLLFFGSSVTEAGRVVCSQLLLGPLQWNSADVMVYVGLPSAATLVAASLVTEAPRGMLAAGRALLAVSPLPFVQASVTSSLVNLTSFIAIATTSSLSFKVAGCLKNLAVVWVGVWQHGDLVTAGHLMGYGVSVAGFALYSATKSGGRPKQA